MSGSREHRRRRALRREYEASLREWRASEPPKILFWWWRKWKKSRPIWDNSKEPRWPY